MRGLLCEVILVDVVVSIYTRVRGPGGWRWVRDHLGEVLVYNLGFTSADVVHPYIHLQRDILGTRGSAIIDWFAEM